MSGHVLVAPDKFKGSLTSSQVAEAIATGLRRARPELDIRLVPVADGGDGTVLAALANGYRRVRAGVTGPVGVPVDAEFALHGSTAVIELAAASGLALLDPDRPAPMDATSAGTGELIRAALDEGARTVVLGIGGSACTDGGAGMLSALGARVRDGVGNPVGWGGGALRDLSDVDLSGLDPRLSEVDLILASDVDNPLLGVHGAAHVYGPQKGAAPEQVELLDAALTRWSAAVVAAGGRDATAEAGAGAAGGVGFAALAALGARGRPGTDVVLDLVGFDAQVEGAGLVITGEGSLDEQTLHGKAPAGVAARAVRAGVPVVAVAGRRGLSFGRLAEAGFAAGYSLADREPDPERCMREAADLLVALASEIARDRF
ncbi:glycerate kinase [Parasphingorhabdus pacifica]